MLVACEESQEVCKAFRARGHEAYSCDLQDCSGGHPEWHIKGDCLPLLNGDCEFWTIDKDGRGVGWHHIIGKWDLIIAHPPCTYLTNAGACNAYRKFASEEYRQNRIKLRDEAFRFAQQIYNADCNKIAIENPIGYLNTHFRKPDQIIHPYEFGHSVNKPTCLWTKNLPKLAPTNIVPKGETTTWSNGKKISVWYKETLRQANTREELSRLRSKTFPGIARAMAEQWGGLA